MVDPNTRRLRAIGAAALVAVLTACGSQTATSPSTSTVPTSAPSTSVTTLASTGADVAEDVLASALAATRSGYLFESTVSVDGTVVTAMTGQIDGGGMEATVSSGGADIEYLATESGRWSRRGGGAWLALPGDVPFSDPLAVLLTPTTVTGTSGSTLTASYSASALGIDGVGEVPVEIAVDGGRIARLEYSVPTGDGVAEVTTVLSPLGTTTPVTAPPA